eukprot:SAG22_NODE_9672_length_575_cov_28.092437_1_plen_82_part_00
MPVRMQCRVLILNNSQQFATTHSQTNTSENKAGFGKLDMDKPSSELDMDKPSCLKCGQLTTPTAFSQQLITSPPSPTTALG